MIFISTPAYALFLNNTLSHLDVPHRAQFNAMISFKPRDTGGGAFATSFSGNYRIMESTVLFVEAPNFVTTSKSGTNFFTNVGGGIRNRFHQIPDETYDFDAFVTLRFPNRYIVFSPGVSLVAYWYGMTWFLEPSVDFIFPHQAAPVTAINAKIDVEYPLWSWVTLHLALSRAAGIHTPFYPVVIVNPDKVTNHLFFANFGIQLKINERIIGHIETALGIADEGSSGNLANVVLGAQYLL
jgi:hypothetical protein